MKKLLLVTLCVVLLFASAFAYDTKLEEKLFYSVGHFGACFLYQTYMSIGLTSDAWVDKSMEPDKAQTILNENLTFLDVSLKVLNDLKSFPMNRSDNDTLRDMISIVRDLKVEADQMLLYIKDRNQTNVNQYDRARLQAWDKIKKLMGIK
jgi:hypothetical protein